MAKQIFSGAGTYDSYWYIWGAYTTPKPWGASVYYAYNTASTEQINYYLVFLISQRYLFNLIFICLCWCSTSHNRFPILLYGFFSKEMLNYFSF